MLNLPGYQILEQIHESHKSRVYKGYRLEDNRPAILKLLKEDYPTPKDISRYQKEFEILCHLNFHNIHSAIQAYGLESYQNSLVIILEDVGGLPLSNYLDSQGFTVRSFLPLAIKIIEALGQIHAAHIIHKDINPSNIIWNQETDEIKIIDFGISSKFSGVNNPSKAPNNLQGTIIYMSPEQTGRMNRTVDYRTDFYSVGMTFYEMLTGTLPFPVNQLTDRMELVHNHIAKQPVNPQKFNPAIPKVVSDIILKLLAKTAEERYQSAWGIRADLAECLQQLENDSEIREFSLGSQDISEQFKIPPKLYGRDTEIQTLQRFFEGVIEGGKSLAIVSGDPGIGKSSLVQEIYQPITQRQGYLLTGKFKPGQENLSYTAIAQAFSGLIRQLLTESEAQLNRWRIKLIDALGDRSQIILDLIPELKLIIDPERAIDEFNAEGTQEASEVQFQEVFLDFIRVFCHEERPIVIFLNDLHWADQSSLKLIELIMQDEGIHHLLLIVAYQDYDLLEASEMPIDAFKANLNILQQTDIRLHQIRLAPLTYEHITDLIAETLQQHNESVKSLAGIVWWKTGGIPFLVRQFLTKLYEENILKYELNSQKFKKPRWTWDIEEIKTVDVTNVSNLPVYRFKKLPESTQYLLHLAAYLGRFFDLKTLSSLYEKSIKETFDILWPGVQQGLIKPHLQIQSSQREFEQRNLLFKKFEFSSSLVKKAAYALIENEDIKKNINLKLGNYLKEKDPAVESHDRIFKILENLNLAADLIVNESEKNELAYLNLKAGKIAKSKNDYFLAKEYLMKGISLLNVETCWEERYDLAIALYKNLADVELATHQLELAEDYLYLLIERLKTTVEKAEIAHKLILEYGRNAKNKQAIMLGRKSLKWLGLELPIYEADISENIQSEIQQMTKYFKTKTIEALIDSSKPMNLAKQMLIKLLTSLSLAAKNINQNLFYLLIVKAVHLTIQSGQISESAYAYAAYGVLLGSVFGDAKASYEFGKLAFNVSKKFNDPLQQCLTYNLYANEILPWYQSITVANSINRQGYQIALNAGELGLARDIFANQSVNSFYQGKFLAHLMADLSHCIELTQANHESWSIDAISGIQLAIANLTGQTSDKFTFANKYYSESEYLENAHKYTDLSGICLYKIYKMQILYLYEDYSQAMVLAKEIENIISYIRGNIANFEYLFYYSLILTALYASLSKSDKTACLIQLASHQRQLKTWVDRCPENFQAKFFLVEAEICRINESILDAMNLYDDVRKLVEGYEYIHIRALAEELAGKFWLAQGKEEFAQLYLEKSRACYQMWGAKRKVEDLESKYASLLSINTEEIARGFDKSKPYTTLSSNGITTLSRTTTYMSYNSEVAILDLGTVMKASQAISSEIVLDKLLEKLMNILLENAGAQKGFLILENQGKLLIEAEGSVESDAVAESRGSQTTIQVLQSIEIEGPDTEDPPVPRAIVNYVARTKENVVLDDATELCQDSGKQADHISSVSSNELYRQFANDSYVRKNKPKSILCAPLMSKGKLYGIVYMENNLTTGAFTPDRLEMLNLLSSQAAISIENSRYYTNMAALNQAYERFVPRQFLHFLKKKSIVDVKLGDNVEQEMSVLFSDIRAFTTLSESLTPEENFKFINSYLSSMEPAILEHNGFIDKYIGDAIMALFPGGADDSVEAAISMLRRLSEYNQGRERAGYVPIEIGIGINTGDLMLGTVGGHSRMDSTVISDAVNLASRLEDLTKIYGVSLLISHQTFLRLSNATKYNIRIIERLKVKGKSHEVAVFEVFDGDEPELHEQKLLTASLFEEALMLYYRQSYQQSEKLFQDCLRQSPKDRAIRVYLERCQANL